MTENPEEKMKPSLLPDSERHDLCMNAIREKASKCVSTSELQNVAGFRNIPNSVPSRRIEIGTREDGYREIYYGATETDLDL